MAHVRVLGIDIAKQIFHIVGTADTGTVVLRKRCSRAALMSFSAQMPPVVIGMEACGGAHYWARRFRQHGHTVKLMAPQFVKSYVKANKHDMADPKRLGKPSPGRRYTSCLSGRSRSRSFNPSIGSVSG
jgi:transposase